MSSTFKKFLSLLMTVAMILSLCALPAAADEPDEGGIVVGETAGESAKVVDAVNYPAQQFSYYEPEGLSIDVKAPAGALPRGTTMEVSRLADLSRVQNAVDRASDIEGSVVLAADISFWHEGEEVEPVEGNKILVTMTAPEIAELNNPVVVHVPDEEPAVAERIDPVPNDDLDSLQMADQISFEAEDFSVYAVIGDPDAPDARLKVVFHDANGNETEIFVKESDTKASEEEYAVILYDPGVGTIEDNALFFAGWTTKEDYALNDPIYDIKAIRNTVKNYDWSTVTEDVTPALHYYAKLLRHITITYLDEKGIAIGSQSQHILPDDTSTVYKVNMTYIPPTNTQNFEGWMVLLGLENILEPADVTENTVFPNNSYITVKGDITFTVNAPEGHWLIFDENGHGGTYNAPQFVKEHDKTSRPRPDEEMYRRGYNFGGWYTDAACTAGNEYGFNEELTQNKTIYAKWTEKTTANYTIVFWTENADCSGYDVKDSLVVQNAAVHSIIPYTVVENLDEDYVTIGSTDYHYTGFCLIDADKTLQVEVTATGDAVLNLHFKRIVYNLKFYLYRQQGTNGAWSYAQNANAGNNVWGIASWYNNINANDLPTSTYPGGVQRDTTAIDGYYGHYILLTAYYGENIANKWPKYDQIVCPANNRDPVSFIMMVGTGLKQNPSNGGDATIKGEVGIMDENILALTNNANGNFLIVRYNTYYPWNYHIFLELADGQSTTGLTTKTVNGVTYYQEKVVVSRSSNQNAPEQNPPQYLGFAVLRQDPNNPESRPYYVSNGQIDGVNDLDYYYERLDYPIAYYDGVYVDADENILLSNGGGYINKSENITYGSPIPDQYKNYVPTTPVEPGFVFEGWYIDQACTTPYVFSTMQIGGITVFAKWRQIQYRVFLRPHATLDDGTYDPTLNWGSESQEMNFRISYGTKASLPFGLRTGYEMVGWFTDATYTHAFDADLTALTESSVTEEYDKTLEINYTDPMDKWGALGSGAYNSDAQDAAGNPRDRFWINNKLELHARWRKIIEGADGVRVIYDVGEGTGDISDPVLYKDTAKAIAQGASTAPEGYRFLYWVVQKWQKNGQTTTDSEGRIDELGEWVDTDVHVFPGNDFEVYVDNAHRFNMIKEQKKDDQGNLVWETDAQGNQILDENNQPIPVMVVKSADYQLQLRAVYGQEEQPDDTYITFWANNGNGNYDSGDYETHQQLMINEAVFIPTPGAEDEHPFTPASRAGTGLSNNGMAFLGWAKLDVEKNSSTGVVTLKRQDGTVITDTRTLGADDLWLRWIEATDTVPAHYEAQKPGTTTWVSVTQVAADEFTPYQDLYAVWADAFYVYHSGTCRVERIVLKPGMSSIDLTALVDTTNFLYGGYYASYGGASSTFVSSPEKLAWKQCSAEGAQSLGYQSTSQMSTWAANGYVATVTDGGTPYTGVASSRADPPWSGDKAYTVAGTDASIANDLAAAKAAGTFLVYYIKEVPAATFLQPRLRFTYVLATGKIGTSWLITNMDDTNYADVGFMVGDEKVVGSKVDSITITPLTVPANEQTLTVADLFPNGGAKMSYAMVYNDMSTYPPDYEAGEGETDCNILTDGSRVHMFWVTLDGMIVTSTAVRTYSNVGTANGYSSGLSAAQSTQTSAINRYEDALSTNYFLVGYINGADNNGGIQFDKNSGKLTVTLTQKAYVAVKNESGHWYKMYNGDFSDPDPTPSSGYINLYDASNNNDQKLPVPAGSVTFMIEELTDSTGIYGVKISYTVNP